MNRRLKKKICFVSSTSEIGGADLSLLTLVRHLDADRYEKMVVLPGPGPYLRDLENAGASIRFVPLHKLKKTWNPFWHLLYLLRFPFTTWRYIQLFRTERPDLVHLNTSVLIQAGLAAGFGGVRVVWHVRELQLKPRWVARLIAAYVHRRADRVICISQAVASEYPVSAKVQVLYNGIEFPRLKTREPSNNKRLIAIARLVPFKGLENAMAVAAALVKEFPDLTLTIVGGMVAGHEHYAEALKQQGWRSLPAETLFWTGPVTDVATCLADADIFVHLPRDPEPLGRTVIEAGAAGLPSVVFGTGGLPEIVLDGKTGCVVPMGDLQAAAEAVRQLIRDPRKTQKLGDAAAEWVREKFNARHYVAGVAKVYETLLS